MKPYRDRLALFVMDRELSADPALRAVADLSPDRRRISPRGAPSGGSVEPTRPAAHSRTSFPAR